MNLARALLDSAVFIYAIGLPHPYKEPCTRLLGALREQEYGGEASVLTMQEILHQRARRTGDRKEAQRRAREAATMCPIHELTVADLQLGLTLFGSTTSLHVRDALHAATAINRGIPTIISPDHAFDEVTGLQRLDPVQAAALL